MVYPADNGLTPMSAASPLARRDFCSLERSSKYSKMSLYRLQAIYRLYQADISHYWRYLRSLSIFLLRHYEFLSGAPGTAQTADISSFTCTLVLLLHI
jgi:hypothetical protein